MIRIKDSEGNIKCFNDIGELILYMEQEEITLIDCSYGDLGFSISI